MYLMLLIKLERNLATLLSAQTGMSDMIQHIIEQYMKMNKIQTSALNDEGRAMMRVILTCPQFLSNNYKRLNTCLINCYTFG